MWMPYVLVSDVRITQIFISLLKWYIQLNRGINSILLLYSNNGSHRFWCHVWTLPLSPSVAFDMPYCLYLLAIFFEWGHFYIFFILTRVLLTNSLYCNCLGFIFSQIYWFINYFEIFLQLTFNIENMVTSYAFWILGKHFFIWPWYNYMPNTS